MNTKSGWRQSTVWSSGCLTLSFFKLFSHEFSVWALLHWALDWKVEEDKGVVDKLVGKQIFWIEMNISPHVGRSWLRFVVTYSLKQSNLDSFCGHRERLAEKERLDWCNIIFDFVSHFFSTTLRDDSNNLGPPTWKSGNKSLFNQLKCAKSPL